MGSSSIFKRSSSLIMLSYICGNIVIRRIKIHSLEKSKGPTFHCKVETQTWTYYIQLMKEDNIVKKRAQELIEHIVYATE